MSSFSCVPVLPVAEKALTASRRTLLFMAWLAPISALPLAPFSTFFAKSGVFRDFEGVRHRFYGLLRPPEKRIDPAKVLFACFAVGIRRNRQKILFFQGPQITPKTARTAHFVVSGNPFMREVFAVGGQHLQGQFMSGTITNLFGNATLFPTFFILGPLFGKIQTHIHQGIFFPRSEVG